MPTCTRGVGASSKASRQSNATRRREPPRGSSNPRHLAMDYGGMAVSVARGCLHLSHLCLLRSCHVARLRGVGMGLGRYYTTIVCEPGLPRAFSLVSRRKEGVRLLLFRCARFLRSPTYVAVSEQARCGRAKPPWWIRQHHIMPYVLVVLDGSTQQGSTYSDLHIPQKNRDERRTTVEPNYRAGWLVVVDS